MPQTLDHLARELRSAVLAADHERASRLAAEYGAALAADWTTLSAEERAGSPLPKQSLELLGWVREMTLMQRAMTGAHLKLVGKAMRYQTARALYLEPAASAAH